MKVVLDANILLRSAEPSSPQHPIALLAVDELIRRGEDLVTFNQSAFEFWVVATRPIVNNGLGLKPHEADAWLDVLLARFPKLDDHSDLFVEWRTLVRTHSISGKPAHDARYVAGMNTDGIAHILTFNVADFARFPGITVLDPVAIAASITP